MILTLICAMKGCLKLVDDDRACDSRFLVYHNGVDLPSFENLEIQLINDENTIIDLSSLPFYRELSITGIGRGHLIIPSDIYSIRGARTFKNITFYYNDLTIIQKELDFDEVVFENTTFMMPDNYIVNLFTDIFTSDLCSVEQFDNVVANTIYIDIKSNFTATIPCYLSFHVLANNNTFTLNGVHYDISVAFTSNVLSFNDILFVDISRYAYISLYFIELECSIEFRTDTCVNLALDVWLIISNCVTRIKGFDSPIQYRMNVITNIYESNITLDGVCFPGEYTISQFTLPIMFNFIGNKNDVYISALHIVSSCSFSGENSDPKKPISVHIDFIEITKSPATIKTTVPIRWYCTELSSTYSRVDLEGEWIIGTAEISNSLFSFEKLSCKQFSMDTKLIDGPTLKVSRESSIGTLLLNYYESSMSETLVNYVGILLPILEGELLFLPVLNIAQNPTAFYLACSSQTRVFNNSLFAVKFTDNPLIHEPTICIGDESVCNQYYFHFTPDNLTALEQFSSNLTKSITIYISSIVETPIDLSLFKMKRVSIDASYYSCCINATDQENIVQELDLVIGNFSFIDNCLFVKRFVKLDFAFIPYNLNLKAVSIMADIDTLSKLTDLKTTFATINVHSEVYIDINKEALSFTYGDKNATFNYSSIPDFLFDTSNVTSIYISCHTNKPSSQIIFTDKLQKDLVPSITIIFDDAPDVSSIIDQKISFHLKRAQVKIESPTGIIPANIALSQECLLTLQTNSSELYFHYLAIYNNTVLSIVSPARVIFGTLHLRSSHKFTTSSLAKNIEVLELVVDAGTFLIEKMNILTQLKVHSRSILGFSSCDLSSAVAYVSSSSMLSIYGGNNMSPPKEIYISDDKNLNFTLIQFQISDEDITDWISCISGKTQDDKFFVVPEKDVYSIKVNLYEKVPVETNSAKEKRRKTFLIIIFIISFLAAVFIIAFICYWKQYKKKQIIEPDHDPLSQTLYEYD